MIKLLEAKVIADLLNQEEVNEFLNLHQNTLSLIKVKVKLYLKLYILKQILKL